MKDAIRDFVLNLGMDDVGFASLDNYVSPRSPEIHSLFPEARTIIVMALREMSHVTSPSPQIAMNGRMDVMEFARHCNFTLARYLEKECHAQAMSVPLSYPLRMASETMGVIGEVSLRHAAVAAGLGVFGRHNLVIHPRLGSQVLFAAVLCDLDLPPDPVSKENLCTECNLCVESCPAQALEKEGLTDVMKCLKVSQPFGMARAIGFWNKFSRSTPEEQQKMFATPDFMSLYQAQMIGFQYFCFKCFSVCPLNSSNNDGSR